MKIIITFLAASIGVATTTADASLGPVVGGYDVVEFHSLQPEDDGIMGSSHFSHDLLTTDYSTTGPIMTPTNWTFHFKNEQNRAAFAENPWKFAPKFGGF
mgnify:FL=1